MSVLLLRSVFDMFLLCCCFISVIMTNTPSSIEVLNEIFPTSVSLPPPRFPDQSEEMVKYPFAKREQADLGAPSRVTSSLTSLLVYVAPLLCVVYIALLSYAYGCPVVADTLEAIESVTSIEPNRLLAAALLVSSAGLITLGIGFLWTDEQVEGDFGS